MSNESMIREVEVLHTCLTCAPVPEVQNIINLLRPMMLAQYDDNVEATLRAALLDLQDFRAEGETTEADEDFFVAALWLSTLRDLSQIDADIDRSAGVGGRQLVRAGAQRAGAPILNHREIAQPSAADLSFWNERIAAQHPSMEGRFRAAVLKFLRGDTSEPGRIALVDELRSHLRLGRVSLVVLLDQWAYRWHAIGAFEGLVAATDAPATLVAINNPPSGPDSRTTPFCAWVHGKPIVVTQARRQIQTYMNAIAIRDAGAAKAAWPILSAEDAARTGDEAAQLFTNLGLPPYHPFCRTVVRRTP